jgi:serine/threonine protein kinase
MERHTVNNKYVVGEKTRGKFGVVYSGTTKKTNTPVAIKYADNDGGLVKHEATILNYLYRRSVKHVPFVIWYGMDALPESHKPALCLIMPKYDCSLTDYAASVDQSPQHRTAVLRRLMANAIYVFKSVHAQFVIHRDVKPDNLW